MDVRLLHTLLKEQPKADGVSQSALIRRYAVKAGQTFTADLNGRSVPMRIERVIDGLAICKSLDLKHTGRWRTDVIARALANGTA